MTLFFDIICDELDQYMTTFCILESLDAASTRLPAIESRHIVSDILNRVAGGSGNWAYCVNFVGDCAFSLFLMLSRAFFVLWKFCWLISDWPLWMGLWALRVINFGQLHLLLFFV